MATDGLSLITVLYGCRTNSGHGSSSGGDDDSQSSSLCQIGMKKSKKSQERFGVSAMGRTVGGGGGAGGGEGDGGEGGARSAIAAKKGAAAVAVAVDDRTVEALSRSCNPSFVQKSFKLCKSVLAS